MNLATITATEILKISESEPERFFLSPEAVEAQYKLAAKRFHPDMPSGNTLAFQHLQSLHNAAKNKIKIGEWNIPNRLSFRGEDGVERKIHFLKEYDITVGKAYISKSIVTYVLAPDVADLAESAFKTISSFASIKYPNDKVKKDFEIRQPKIKSFFKTSDKKSVLVLEKPEELVRLRDVLDHYKTLNPKHVAWIMSELHNICCWLEFSKRTHNDLSLDSVFISPQKHYASVIGGWWFSSPVGERMKRVQLARTIKNAPQTVLDTKVSNVKTDLALIRVLGRELLGELKNEKDFLSKKEIHPSLANWLRIATTGNAKNDYKLWGKILTDSFGERVFTKMELKSTDVYKE